MNKKKTSCNLIPDSYSAIKPSEIRSSESEASDTEDEVNTLMDTIIAKDIFKTTTGALAKKSGAQVTQRQVTKFEVA